MKALDYLARADEQLMWLDPIALLDLQVCTLAIPPALRTPAESALLDRIGQEWRARNEP